MASASETQNGSGMGADPEISGSRPRTGGDGSRRAAEACDRTDAEFPAGRCIHELVEEQVERTPGAVAVVHEHEALTYRGLNERANRLAHHLARLGAGPEVRVGVCLERGIELVVSLLAVLKSGGAYVPLDPAYPPERLALMLAGSGAAVLVTTARLRALAAAPAEVAVLCLDGAAAEIAAERAENPASGVAPRNLAYLIHTSGSTGTPKAVAIEHESAVAMLAWAWSVYPADELAGMLASTSVCFDMSVFELFAPLGRGGRVIVVENALALPASSAAGQVRLIDTVPSAIAALLDARGIPPGVRTVNLGGELLRQELVDALYAGGVERVYDLYGPSEDTTFSTCALRRAGGEPHIGRPISNTRCHVVDAELRPVPAGQAGELYIGGRGVTRGYLGRPGLTAERYLPDPFSPRPGARMYRTGDRVRRRGDGTLQYLGRLDHQVKIRGFRVEPGEVEAALRRHGAVRDCVVVAREEASGEKRLAAYVVGSCDAETLRGHLRGSLPEYMVPGAFVFLAALPLTPNGKVDRGALPAPEVSADEAGHVAPRTATEAALERIWAALLGVERVSVDRPFLELGAHSLLGIRVLARIAERFGVRVPPQALLADGRIEQIAARVDAERAAAPEAGVPPLAPAPRDRPIPLSFSQQATWFFEQFSPGQLAYRAQATLRFRGPLDVPALERALGEIVRRHEIFRTTFPVEDGGPVQKIHPPWRVCLPLRELDGVEEERREDALGEAVFREFLKPFDVTALPLVWWSLLRVAPRDHVLVMVEHHFVHDGWSFGVFLRELRALYLAYAAGRESPLPEPALQFADFAVWQRRWMETEAAQAGLRFWEAELAGVPPLELATDFPRPAVMRFRGARERVLLPPALAAEARAFAREHGATFFMTLMAAFQALLGRYSGQAGFCVGSGLGNRSQVALEEVIGMVVNTVAIRADLSGDPTALELLARVRETTLRAHEHQDVPFDQVVRRLQPERSATTLPVYQVSFAAHDSPMADLRFGAATVELQDVLDNGSAKFDLQVTVIPRAEQGIAGREHEVVLVWEYNTDLFAPATVRRMARHYERLLEGMVREPGRRLSALRLLDDGERERVVEGWNRTAEPVAPIPVHRAFAEQARRTPGAVALEWEGGTLTYGELDRRANRLANHLASVGVGPETRVGVRLERGPDLIVAVLAALKAGGAYVPLDAGHPDERVAWMLADAGVAVLVTDEALRAPARGLPALPVVSVDGHRARIAAASAAEPAVEVAPEGLAYVIYTSGSTGAPRGVAVEHRALANHMAWFVRDFVAADERVLQKTPLGFDASGWEVFAPLLAGARLVLAAHGGERDPRYLARAAAEGGITTLQVVPSVLRALLDEPGLAACASLRQLFCGGEALTGELCRRVAEVLPQVRVVNLYGPTECCIDATLHRCTDDDPAAGGVPIGRPVANTRAYVLDARLGPLPAGVPGELCLGGVQVARGYLGRPAATAERFVPDPFSAAPGARLYRTGDRARWREAAEAREPGSAEAREGGVAPDSARAGRTRAPADERTAVLEYLGRLDGQVKLRGVRVEPGEIEALLREDAAVADCVVVARDDGAGETRLVAYVAGAADAEALRARLRRRLPESLVPAAFVALDALPRTAGGKVDRRALPEPDLAGAAERYAAPRTPVEEVLAEIWADLLRVQRVGVHDDFFALGGHSLVATRVASRAGEVFGVELPLRTLFEAPTVAALAARVEELRREAPPRLPPVAPAARTGALPLSFAQERLWFLERLAPGDASYNIARVLRLTGALDERALERALGEVVRRHEALRTVFAEVDGSPVQVVAPFAGFALPVEDLSGLDGDAREAAVRRRAAEEAARPFDLAAGPLFRFALLRLGPAERVLLLSLHHVVSDEWSMGVLFRELSALYAAYREGRGSPLPEPRVQYADFAVWQRAQLRGEALERELAYWKARLADAPAQLELPTDHPRPAVRTPRGAREFFALPGELWPRLQALGRGEGATPFMVLLGAFQALLAKYGGSGDVVVGSPIAGRTRREVEELIGFFANTLVLRADLSGDPSFREVLRRVREVTLGAYEHQQVPFERLVAELQPERSRSRSPLFQVMFVLENADRSALELPGVAVRRVNPHRETSKFDLTLFVSAEAGAPAAVLEYSTDLFERATIVRMAGHLRRLLEQIAADPGISLSRADLLDEAERRCVLEAWNRTATERDEACVHHRVERQAARTPEAVAVVHHGRTLTYRALNQRANRLAHRLIAEGVGPEARVAICLERGPELVVAVLAVLKAGGACVPLDPAYPARRLEFMLQDAAAPVLLAQAPLLATLPAPDGVRVLAVDGAETEGAGRVEDPSVRVDPRNLAYVLYTSGSTGTPKGVMQTHAMLSNLVAVHGAGGAGLQPWRTLQFASLSFDVSFQEIAVTLASGGALVLVDDELRRDPDRLSAFLARERVERVFLPFVALQALAEAAGHHPLRLALREIVTAGEQLVATPQIAALVGGIPGCRLINHYGPTETHVATAHALAADPAAWPALPPIGRPVANAAAYVLDAALRPVPVGVPGGVYVGGAQVARGYLDRPSLTAARFVPDPFGAGPGARLYATGDRARWRADGELEYLGRADLQVKVRGFRVEPGEVEAALRQHAGVRDCAVVAREDAAGERRLVAYVAGTAGAGELRAHLRQRLPEHLVPAAFVAVDALPLTPSGKLDRRALPAPEYASTEGYVAPRTPTEEALAAIWADVLGRERVGVRDDFFALGGHSLLAVRVASRIRGALDGGIGVAALFDHPTIDGLARFLSERRAAGRAGPRQAGPASSPRRLLAALDELPEEELDRLLAATADPQVPE